MTLKQALKTGLPFRRKKPNPNPDIFTAWEKEYTEFMYGVAGALHIFDKDELYRLSTEDAMADNWEVMTLKDLVERVGISLRHEYIDGKLNVAAYNRRWWQW